MSAATGKHGDRIKDTASAVSGSTVTLNNSAPTGFLTFGTFYSNADVCPSYLITDGTNWEVSYGAYTSSGTTLARASTPISSSNSGSQVVSFSGTITVACVDCAIAGADFGASVGSVISGRRIGPAPGVGNPSASTTTITVGKVYYIPVNINQWFSSANLYHFLSAVFAGTATMDIGLYNTLNGAPNSRLGQVTGVNVGTGGTASSEVNDGNVSFAPQPPGVYWIAVVVATNTPTFESWNTSSAASYRIAETCGLQALSSSGYGISSCVTQTNATLPTTAAAAVDVIQKLPMVGCTVSL